MSAKTVMSDFYKKNKALVIFLILTLIGSVALVVMCATTCSKVTEMVEAIKKDGDEVEKINKKGKRMDRENPKIVKGNADRIKEDAAALADKTRELQRVCGQGYDPAFVASFCAEGMPKLGDYFAAFKTVTGKDGFQVAEYGKAPTDEKLEGYFTEVRKEITKDDPAAQTRFDEAFVKFKAELVNFTAEDLSSFGYSTNPSLKDLPAKAIFLQVLGLPRVILVNYLENYCNYLETRYKAAYGTCVAEDAVLKRMLTNSREDEGGNKRSLDLQNSSRGSGISQEYVIDLCRLFQIYEQVLVNVKKVRETSASKDFVLHDCAPAKSSPFGYEDEGNGFHSYKVGLKVSGSLADVRTFVNNLHNAYKDNHVFRMYNFSLKNASVLAQSSEKNDLSKGIFSDVYNYCQYLNSELVEEVQVEADKTAEKEGFSQKDETMKTEVKLKEYKAENDTGGYGTPLLGLQKHKTVVVELTFDYVIFNPTISEMKQAK